MARIIAVVGVLCVAASLAGCAIDFDAPFEQSPNPSAGGTGSSAGAAGTGGTSVGSGGTAGSTGGTAGNTGGTGASTGGTAGSTGGTGGSTGGTGGTAGSTGGTAGSTGGTGGSDVEGDCTNAVDDDGDGYVDCADPDCAAAGFACIPVPNGWDGPMMLRTHTTTPSPCSGAWGSTYAEGGIDPTSPSGETCPDCSCEPATNAQCGIDVTLYDQSGCSGNTQIDTFMATGTCINVGMQAFGPESLEATSSFYVASGSCAANTTGSQFLPAPYWGIAALACEATVLGGGCGSGEVCSPPPAGGDFCVAQAGEASCPLAFPSRTVIDTAFVDSRTCTACTCGPPTGNCAGCEVSVEDPSGNCPGNGEVITSSVCIEVPVHPTYGTFSLESWAPSSVDATCTPAGGAIVGNVTSVDPITFCCSG